MTNPRTGDAFPIIGLDPKWRPAEDITRSKLMRAGVPSGGTTPGYRTADLFTWIPMDIDPENRLIFDRAHEDPFGLPEVQAVMRISDTTRRRAEDGLAEHFRIASAIGDLGNGWYPTFLKPGESTHFMGSCRMGPRDDATSVVDSHGRLWSYDNLYVAGNAVLARANAGNPSIISIACALRTVNRLLGNLG